VLPPWDNWGYAWRGKLTTGWAKNLGHYSYVTMGFDDVKNVLQAVRGIKFIRSLNILYIGDIPSHSVNADINPIRIYEKFGCTITPVSFHEYADEVEKADMKKAKEMADRWKSSFNMMDNTESKVEKYTSIYIAVKKLMEKYEANALTVDCAYLPSVELVPCVTASLISDEGYPFGCEGDTNQLITAAMMMGVSGHATLMGNLFENALHKDILNNQIVINHDVLPPSMACKGCKINFRDFHEQRKGSTLYADLKKETVTMGGMNFDSSEMWLSKGNVAWTEDTAHCRISIGFEVEDAKRIARESLGHHQVIVYGDYIKSIQMMCDFLNLKYRNI
jgi:L-fucose isomerase-like protein